MCCGMERNIIPDWSSTWSKGEDRMQTSPTNWDEIITGDHWFETGVNIDGVLYLDNVLISVSTVYRVFSENQPAVGGCLAAELTVEMLAPSVEIPRMAKVRPYVRAKNGTLTSGWLPQGVFYIDTRQTTHNDDGLDILTLHCYDAMLKAEADYPSTSISYPAKDYRIVQIIAYAMGLQNSSAASNHDGIDARTKTLMNNGSGIYNIGLPVSYSMREVLANIAAMYAGNWILTYEGKLRLVTLTELPDETYYLMDEHYDAITFGGDRILV